MTSSKKSGENWRSRWLKGDFNKKKIEKKDKTLDEFEHENKDREMQKV